MLKIIEGVAGFPIDIFVNTKPANVTERSLNAGHEAVGEERWFLADAGAGHGIHS